MDGRCVYLFLSIFIINLLSVTNCKKLYIKDSFKVKPFDDRLQSKKLEKIVVDVLTSRYNKRKMIDVPRPFHKLYMSWRGIRTFFAEKMLYIFCPTLLNELKAVRALKEMVSSNKRIQKQLNLTLPFKKSKSSKSNIKIKKGKKDSASDEESYEESDEESDEKNDEDSDEESSEDSDEKDKKKKKKPVKKGEKSKTKDDDDDNDDSDSYSDEDSSEEKGKKKKRKKNLDDLFE